MEARVTSQSQTFRLVERMQEANIHHGQEIRADLPNIRVVALAGTGDGQALFCTMGPMRVRETLNQGDGNSLPIEVTLQGLSVPTSGAYHLLNARVSSNGDIRLVVDEQTTLVPVPSRFGEPFGGRSLLAMSSFG